MQENWENIPQPAEDHMFNKTEHSLTVCDWCEQQARMQLLRKVSVERESYFCNWDLAMACEKLRNLKRKIISIFMYES